MGKVRPYDYLFLSTRVKSLERNLLNRERMDRMLEARSNEDALEVLLECDYGEVPAANVQAIDKAIDVQRTKMMEDLAAFAPDRDVVDSFKVRYDYHNVKVLLKSEAMGVDAERLLLDTGRVSVKVLENKVRSNDPTGLPPILATAVAEARDVLGSTGDPQLADFALDRAYYLDMDDIAQRTGSEFLRGYVRVSVDAANLRSVVRTLRMGKGIEFLSGVLFAGGNLDTGRILNAVGSGSSLEELYTTSLLREAAEEATHILGGGPMTRFEKLTDDAVTAYLASAKYVAFGESSLISYIAAKENEFTAVRIIMAGRMAGLDTETIRERLREAYV